MITMNRTLASRASDPLVDLAKQAIELFATSGQTLETPHPLPPEMARQAGVFVSIKKNGDLRGCIGTFLATQDTLAHEIIVNAIQSASADPRFPPIEASELSEISISVDILTRPEPCEQSQLDPARYGVVVEHGWRRGLLLPDLDGVETVADQVAIAKRKAGIRSDEPVRLSRFTVERHA